MLLLLATTAQAVPFQQDIDRNVNLRLGLRSIPARPIDDDLTVCRIRIARNQWTNPDAHMRVRIEHSVDNGLTWNWVEGTADGRPAGTDTLILIPLNPPLNGVPRLIKGEYEVSGARFRSTISWACDVE